MRMMAASAYRCLPRTSGVPSAAHCGIRDEDRARFRVLPVGLGAGSRRSFENGRVGQCISKWASGEFRRRVFGQRNAVALPYRPGRRELKVVAEEKFDVAKAAGFLVKTGKNALDAGTNLVPYTQRSCSYNCRTCWCFCGNICFASSLLNSPLHFGDCRI
uniref:Uncharacterized protein n=1 Tax=Physcomitrium patens TaxID=3218 RepID=A0A7I4CUU4_PHYPA